MKKLWVTWEEQPRNESMANLLDVPLEKLESTLPKGVRHAVLFLETLALLIRTRPRYLFVQNPSLMLALEAVIFRPFFNYTLIIDAHNGGLFPLEGHSKLLNRLAKFVAVRANWVIVTNEFLATEIKGWGARPIVFPDPLPDLESYILEPKERDIFQLFFVCTWSADEPFLDVIKLFRKTLSDQPICLVVSGNHKNRIPLNEIPKNVKLTGFLSKQDYYNTFASCDGAIILTNRENCLNCGAYESVSLEKPGILANTKALKDYFNKGFIHTDLTENSIEENILRLVNNREALKKDCVALKKSLLAKTTDTEFYIEN